MMWDTFVLQEYKAVWLSVITISVPASRNVGITASRAVHLPSRKMTALVNLCDKQPSEQPHSSTFVIATPNLLILSQEPPLCYVSEIYIRHWNKWRIHNENTLAFLTAYIFHISYKVQRKYFTPFPSRRWIVFVLFLFYSWGCKFTRFHSQMKLLWSSDLACGTSTCFGSSKSEVL